MKLIAQNFYTHMYNETDNVNIFFVLLRTRYIAVAVWTLSGYYFKYSQNSDTSLYYFFSKPFFLLSPKQNKSYMTAKNILVLGKLCCVGPSNYNIVRLLVVD